MYSTPSTATQYHNQTPPFKTKKIRSKNPGGKVTEEFTAAASRKKDPQKMSDHPNCQNVNKQVANFAPTLTFRQNQHRCQNIIAIIHAHIYIHVSACLYGHGESLM